MTQGAPQPTLETHPILQAVKQAWEIMFGRKSDMVFPLSNVGETFHLLDEEGPLPSLLPDIERLVSVAAREASMKKEAWGGGPATQPWGTAAVWEQSL